MTEWFVYVLQCSDGTLYTGITNNLERRIKIHNSGKGSKYTRSRIPCKILDFCEMPNKSCSLKAEIKIKKLKREKKLEILQSGLRSFLFPENLDTN